MKYFHELTDEEMQKVYDDNLTWADAMKMFKQPDWCTYPDALSGMFGCWSLTDKELRKQISVEFCKDCDCFKKLNSDKAAQVSDTTKVK